MKKPILSIALAAALLLSCSESQKQPTPFDQAKANAQAHLYTILDDTSSYEPVVFDTLQALTVADTLRFHNQVLKAENEELHERLLFLVDMDARGSALSGIREEITALETKYEANSAAILTNLKSTDTTIAGYLLPHRFRAKNKFGATVLHNGTFRLDTSYRVVAFDSE